MELNRVHQDQAGELRGAIHPSRPVMTFLANTQSPGQSTQRS
jgi:hypothetical protein